MSHRGRKPDDLTSGELLSIFFSTLDSLGEIEQQLWELFHGTKQTDDEARISALQLLFEVNMLRAGMCRDGELPSLKKVRAELKRLSHRE